MDLDRLESLLKLLNEQKVTEFNYRDDSLRLNLRLGTPVPVIQTVAAPVAAAPAPVAAAPSAPALPAPAVVSDPGLTAIHAPMVGTFYRASSPGARPFVEIGQVVAKGQPLCIIEAMKLMNEIEAEAGGTIAEILVENGHPIQFGQPIFRIRPS
jgi:acetyl-CoA carboxylase biotin carboxyl carrier protein